MSARSEHQSVPLSVLLKRELANEKIEKPEVVILHGQASENKKGEDFTLLKTECQRVLGDGVSTYLPAPSAISIPLNLLRNPRILRKTKA